MKFIPALIKQCLQPARQAGTEGLQSETSDSIQRTASVRGDFSNKEAANFNVGQPAVSLAKGTQAISASADNRSQSSNSLTRDIHQQEMDSMENRETSDLPGSSFFDVAADSVAETFTENINRPVQQQKMESEKRLISDSAPSITLTNTEPHSQSERVYDRGDHGAIGYGNTISSVEKTLQNTVDKHKPATKELYDSKAPGQDADSTHRSIRPQDDVGLADVESSTEQSELTGARALSSEDNKEPPIVGSTAIKPSASSIVQELSHARQPLQLTNPGSKSNEIPQVRIGHINVLIDDQVAAKPRRSFSTKTASSSIPFGLRGL